MYMKNVYENRTFEFRLILSSGQLIEENRFAEWKLIGPIKLVAANHLQ